MFRVQLSGVLKICKMVADGALAQLARAPALQAGGPGFESPTLHQIVMIIHYRYNLVEYQKLELRILHSKRGSA